MDNSFYIIHLHHSRSYIKDRLFYKYLLIRSKIHMSILYICCFSIKHSFDQLIHLLNLERIFCWILYSHHNILYINQFGDYIIYMMDLQIYKYHQYL